jgi:hypothetical protein
LLADTRADDAQFDIRLQGKATAVLHVQAQRHVVADAIKGPVKVKGERHLGG